FRLLRSVPSAERSPAIRSAAHIPSSFSHNTRHPFMPLIRSISGLRGTLGDGLTPETVVRYVSAFAAYTGGGPVIVGHDGRPSGAWIEQVVIGTLVACGVQVRRLGMAPTPTVQMAVEKS